MKRRRQSIQAASHHSPTCAQRTMPDSSISPPTMSSTARRRLVRRVRPDRTARRLRPHQGDRRSYGAGVPGSPHAELRGCIRRTATTSSGRCSNRCRASRTRGGRRPGRLPDQRPRHRRGPAPGSLGATYHLAGADHASGTSSRWPSSPPPISTTANPIAADFPTPAPRPPTADSTTRPRRRHRRAPPQLA